MSEHVLIERPEALDGAVQVIRFNRPDKKNAFTREMYAAMTEALKSGDAEAAVQVHVFLGMPGAFSAGNDMQDFMAYASGGSLGTEVRDFLRALATAKKTMIAGVDGLAIGIGTTMQLHCDLTLATPRSQFRTPFVDLGLVPEAGSSLLAPRIMGHQRAFALLAAGASFSADDARDAGLICKVVAEDRLEDEVLQTALTLARKPQEALRRTRDLLRNTGEADVLERIEMESRLFGRMLSTPEAKAAIEAFMNRKKS